MSEDLTEGYKEATSSSFWEKNSLSKTDILIVGAGFTGLQTALNLKEKNTQSEITIIDSLAFGAAASTRNAGFACFGSPSEILSDLVKIGREKTTALIRSRYVGIEKLRENLKEKGLSFSNDGGHEIFRIGDEAKFEHIGDKLALVNEITHEAGLGENVFSVKPLSKAQGTSFVPDSFYNGIEFQLNPAEWHQHLEEEAQEQGIKILRSVSLKSFKREQGFWVSTSSKGSFRSSFLVLCNNAGARHFLPEASVRSARGQVLVTGEIPNLPWIGSYHLDEGFYYFRNIGERLLLGGARNIALYEEYTDSQRTSDLIQNHLESFAKECLVPPSTSIEHKWAGTMCFRSDGNKTPIVKEIEPNLFVAAAFGGMGVALSGNVSEQLVRLINV